MLLSAAIVLSAFLLFQVQPMIAKMILPWFGGSAAVWITAMLFFQLVLLAGYLYAHWSVRTLSSRRQAALHGLLLLVSLAALPIAPPASWKPAGSEEPISRILGLLAVSVGLPYFLLSSTSPLIQAWHARSRRESLPYRLFALSNLASLSGLLAYPFIVEPYATLRQQSGGWSAVYGLFVLLMAAAALVYAKGAAAASLPASGEADPAASRRPLLREQMLWLLLAACGSAMLLAVTNHLTQNVASIPFLWVLPLGLYLLSFVITFDYERLYHRPTFQWLMAFALLLMSYGLTSWNSRTSLRLVIPAFSSGLFVVCLFCHGELVKRKPAPQHLTSFYLMLSLGGALGGVLVGLLAPLTLSGYYELPIALMAVTALLLALLDYRAWRMPVVAGWTAAVCVFVLAGSYLELYGTSSRVTVRNFYGGLRVHEYAKDTEDEARALVHGMVNHGMQFTDEGRRREHITYYGPGSGVSLAMAAQRRQGMRAGVLGLGAGALAAFSERGDDFRFYEINPLVEQIARSEFSYLADAKGAVAVVPGDGRLSLERETGRQFDILVADAFSGDAIPVHLITREALELYFQRLAPAGILALNITNAHLDLDPVVAALAKALGKHALIIENGADLERRIFHARWALLSSRPFPPSLRAVAEQPATRPGLRVWTDDYSNLFQILK
jgi:spermidine synthase